MNDIVSAHNNIISNLRKRRLKDVFDQLRNMIKPLNDGALGDKLESLETTYRYMIKYMLEGVVDPQRNVMYRTLVKSLYDLADVAADRHISKTASSFYYDQRRYYAHSKARSLPAAMENLHAAENALAAALEANVAEIPVSTLTSLRLEVETCQDEIFVQLLTEYPVSDESLQSVQQLLDSGLPCRDTACLAVSAVTLGALYNYDEMKLLLLAYAYAGGCDEEVRQRALCGLLILLYIYRDRVVVSHMLIEKVAELRRDSRFCRDVRNQFMQFIRTMETERISDIFTKEILPEVMKMAPGLHDKIKSWDKGGDSLNAPDRNPQWEELLNSSGISERIKELNELQIEGSDVLLTTFSSLKSFPFFSRITNWFRPFDKDNTNISGAFDGLGSFSDTISASRFMCNSDKYSLALAVTHLPAQQRDMMINQMPAGKEEAEEVMKTESDGIAYLPKSISNQYIQDLYRFFKLAPASFKSRDIFSEHINLPGSPLLYPIFNDDATLRLIGEYYLKKEYYGYAEKYFVKLSQRNEGDAVLHQKAGYCKQMQKDYSGAIKEYVKADTLSNDFWTLHHLAASCRSAGRLDEALKYYRQAQELQPDNLSIEMQCGHCLLAMGLYEEALKHYYKVEYFSGGSVKSWRPLAWCSFLLGKIPQAWQYYGKILAAAPTYEDFLNAGHTALATRQFSRACDLYGKSIAALDGDLERFYEVFSRDRDILLKSGVEAADIAIMLDQLEYATEQKQST